MKATRKLFVLTPLCALMAAGSAYATDGYFPIGYGMKAQGMGGASVAATDTAYSGANNPAASAFSGNRVEGDLSVFMPDRGMTRTGAGPMDASIDSGSKSFLVPAFGYTTMINSQWGAGVTVYGNGGMNTDFAGEQISAMSACAMFNPAPGPYNLLCGNGRLGVDLMQLMVAPYALSLIHISEPTRPY